MFGVVNSCWGIVGYSSKRQYIKQSRDWERDHSGSGYGSPSQGCTPFQGGSWTDS